jgi:hypothetical protein
MFRESMGYCKATAKKWEGVRRIKEENRGLFDELLPGHTSDR